MTTQAFKLTHSFQLWLWFVVTRFFAIWVVLPAGKNRICAKIGITKVKTVAFSQY